jgi:hypothetical protein
MQVGTVIDIVEQTVALICTEVAATPHLDPNSVANLRGGLEGLTGVTGRVMEYFAIAYPDLY